jgi:hypothetical protein
MGARRSGDLGDNKEPGGCPTSRRPSPGLLLPAPIIKLGLQIS